MANKKAKFNFEKSLKKLESIVDAIEQGKLGLEESLELFSEGVKITKDCQQALKKAEQKVKILTGEDLTDFQSDYGDEEDEDEEGYDN